MSKKPHKQPEAWKNVVGASVHENFTLAALTALDTLVDRRYLPAQRHLQLLLHLATDSKSQTEDLRRAPSPLNILYHYLDLFGSNLLPHLPQQYKGPTDYGNPRTPNWLAWKPNGDLERVIRNRSLRCARVGIWSLIWEPVEKKSTVRKRRGEDSDADDEADVHVISDDGWRLLEWLVDLWWTSPPAVLAQLHKPASSDLQYDDSSVPVAIVRAAFLPTDPPTPLNVLPDRRTTASKLLSLIIDLARPPNVSFHTQSLILSLMSLFRVPAVQIPTLSRAITDWNARAYILAVALEDAAGVRKEREASRSRRSRNPSRSVGVATSRRMPMTNPRSRSTTMAVEDEYAPGASLSVPFQAPDVDYALDLLALKGDERSPVLAAELVGLLVAHYPKDDAWLRVDDDFVCAHEGVLARVLLMARKKADRASERVTVTGTKARRVEAMDVDEDGYSQVDETQSTVPLTASQLAELSAEDRRSGSSPLTPLTDEDDGRGSGGGRSDNAEESQTTKTQPLTEEQRAHFADDLESIQDDEESQVPAQVADDLEKIDGEESQVPPRPDGVGSFPSLALENLSPPPPETLALSETQRAQYDEDDTMGEESQLPPGPDDARSSQHPPENLSPPPPETLPLNESQCARFDEDDVMGEESQLTAETVPLSETQQARMTSEDSEAALSEIIGEAQSLSPMDGEESQIPAETLPLSRSQRAQYGDHEESQLA